MHFLLFFSLKVYFLHFYCTLYTYLSSVNYILVVVREKERGNRMTSRLAIPLFEFLKSIYYKYVDLLANFSRTIAYNNVIDFRFVTIFG